MYLLFSNFKILSLLSLAFVTLSIETNKNESLLVIVLPQSTLMPMIFASTHDEILSSIEMATVSINNDSRILSNVKLVSVDSGSVMCTYCPYSGSMLEVVANLTWNDRFADILGIVGLVHPSVLNALRLFQLPVVSLIHFSGLPHILNTVYMTVSTSTLVESILSLATVIGVDNFGVITEENNTFYQRLSIELLSKLEHHPNLTATISSPIHNGNENHVISDIIATDARVLFLSMSSPLSSRILCQAYKKGLLWPRYAWILHRFQFESLPTKNAGNYCNTSDVFDGVFVIHPSPSVNDEYNISNIIMPYYKMSEQFKMDAMSRLIHDAIYVLTAFANNSDGLDNTDRSFKFNGASGFVEFDDQNSLISNIDIYQASNKTVSLVGIFSGAVGKLIHWNANVILQDGVEADVAFKKLLPTYIILCILITLCIFLNTVLMALYVYFRKEPDIKATSMSLSLLIFVGCYLLAGFTIVAVTWQRYTLIPVPLWQLCVVNTWLSGLGVSIPLILATILVKMLRIYYIFTRHSRIKVNFAKSDYALAIYTVLIVSPNVMVLIIWLIVDPFYDDIRRTEYPEFNLVVDKYHCKSNHQVVWFGILVLFFVVLSTAVIVVAIKTRKIRQKHFKDTKKVNLLIFLLLFIIAFTLSFWLLFTDLYDHIVLIVLVTGHLLTAFLCQFILVFPKVWPPLQKKMIRKYRSWLLIDE